MSNVKKQFVGLIASASLLSAGALLAAIAAHGTTPPKTPARLSQNALDNTVTTNWTCGKYRITIIANYTTGTFTYRTQGLTLTNGIKDGGGDATYYTFRNDNYTYRLTSYQDNAGELKVVKSMPGGAQNVKVREDCTKLGQLRNSQNMA